MTTGRLPSSDCSRELDRPSRAAGDVMAPVERRYATLSNSNFGALARTYIRAAQCRLRSECPQGGPCRIQQIAASSNPIAAAVAYCIPELARARKFEGFACTNNVALAQSKHDDRGNRKPGLRNPKLIALQIDHSCENGPDDDGVDPIGVKDCDLGNKSPGIDGQQKDRAEHRDCRQQEREAACDFERA